MDDGKLTPVMNVSADSYEALFAVHGKDGVNHLILMLTISQCCRPIISRLARSQFDSAYSSITCGRKFVATSHADSARSAADASRTSSTT